MSNGKKRRVSGRRGKTKATGVRPKKKTVTYNDTMPSGDRYNLAFYYKYKPKEELLRKVDEAYFKFYHDEFPSMLFNQFPWTGKPQMSRTWCKCDELYQIESIVDIAAKLHTFLQFNDKKKIGTIFISGHGSRTSLSIPIDKGLPVVSVENMVTGLDSALFGALSTTPPKGWSSDLWQKCLPGFQNLEHRLSMLERRTPKHFDAESMIRFWVCFLGADAKNLETVGRIFVKSGPLQVEAPKVRSLGGDWSWNRSDGRGAFNDMNRRKFLHPDVAAAVKSDDSNVLLSKSDLRDGTETFEQTGIQKTSVEGRTNWFPYFGLEKPDKKHVFPGNYSAFRSYWTNVALK